MEAPEYVRNHLEDLGTLISMVEDSEWPLEEQDRQRLIAALSYSVDCTDMIPDEIPGFGFPDDALMAELVMRELGHELDGYRDFCEYRKTRKRYAGGPT